VNRVGVASTAKRDGARWRKFKRKPAAVQASLSCVTTWWWPN